MKKIIGAFLLIAITSSYLSAQDKNEPVVSPHILGGVILGLNASQIDGDDYAGYHKLGINTGFYGQIPVSKIFFFSTEILFSQKGATNPVYQNIPVSELYKWTMQTVEVPLVFHFQDKKAFNIGVGVSYSRLVDEKLEASGIEQPPTQTCNGKPTNTDLLDLKFLCLRKSDYLVLAEASYLPIKHLAINVRFEYSMAPMGYYGNSNFVNRGMYTNLLSFRAMWIFGN